MKTAFIEDNTSGAFENWMKPDKPERGSQWGLAGSAFGMAVEQRRAVVDQKVPGCFSSRNVHCR
jgi:hypothetical protein